MLLLVAARVVLPKLNNPPIWKGVGQLSHWTGAVTRWLDAGNIVDGKTQVAYVSTFLDPTLGHWYDSVKVKCIDWATMKHELELRFQPLALSKVARSKLDGVIQGKRSVIEYHSHFLSISSLIEKMTDDEKLHRFMSGLHPKLRERLELANVEYTKFEDVVNAATLSESRRMQFIKTQFPVRGGFNNHGSSSNYNSSNSSSSTSSTAVPMDLSFVGEFESEIDIWSDSNSNQGAAAAAATATTPIVDETAVALKQVLNFMQKNNNHNGNGATRFKSNNNPKVEKLTQEEREKCMREGRCFRCRQTGHMSNKCPSFNKVKPTPQGK